MLGLYGSGCKNRDLKSLVIAAFSAFSLFSYSTSYAETTNINLEHIHDIKPVVGIILPASPNTLSQYLAVMKDKKTYVVGGLKYTVGIINNVPTVISVPPPIGDFTYTSIDTYILEKFFKPKMVIDPGTAGSHRPMLTMGDVVIGARIVDFTNYMTTRDGKIEPGTFNLLSGDNEGYSLGKPNPEYLYSDPRLTEIAYESAEKVAKHTPADVLHAKSGRRPWVIHYGTQGSGTIWFRNIHQINQSTKIFHEDDEAGDFPIALISSMNKIPFVEIHTISDSAINVPTKIDKYFHECSVYGQERSNEIVIQMIKMIANIRDKNLPFHGGEENPYLPHLLNTASTPTEYVVAWTHSNGVRR